jgi:ankyrin repeat protein
MQEVTKALDPLDQLCQCIVHDGATFEIIADLVRQGASLDVQTDNEDNVFHVAARSGASQSLVGLIDFMKKTAAAEKISRGPLEWLENKYYSRDSDLPAKALDLLKAKNKQGSTPLHLAASGGYDHCVRLLMSKASIHSDKDHSLRTPVICASQKGHHTTVMILAEMSADLHIKSKVLAQPIHWAALSGNVGLVRFMRDRKVPLFEYDSDDRLPSCYAAMIGSVEILQVLYEAGDRFEGKPPTDWALFQTGFETPMKFAAQLVHHTTIRYLAQVGASVNQVDRNGFAPIHHAANADQLTAVEVLAEHGADFMSLSKEGELPIQQVKDDRWKQRFWSRHGMSTCKDSYSYACLCYMSSFHHPEDRTDLKNTPEEKIFQTAEAHIAAQGWKRYLDCLEMSVDTPLLQKAIEDHHYYGIIYYREVGNEIEWVIAHRGTDLSSVPNLVADGQIMGREMPALFTEATLPFLQKFLALLTSPNRSSIYNKPAKSITHVGFSLGGFLAAAAAVKTPSPITFAKTFDAPGADFLVNHHAERIISPRIVNYVALPNLVNSCNHHIGLIFQISCVPVVDGQDSQHAVVFEVPSKKLIGHFLETLNRHDLGEMIRVNQKRQAFYLRAVKAWPRADIELIFGPFPKRDDYRIGLINAVGRLLETVLSMKVWKSMQRRAANGQMVGLIEVKHSCDYTVHYLHQGNERAVSYLSSVSTANQIGSL